jgi:endonuclease-3 related protein
MNIELSSIYKLLKKKYGSQGWWPIVNPDTGKSEYDLGVPRNTDDIFEIAIGAILTQNVAWINVEKGIANLKRAGIFSPQSLLKAKEDKIASLITSTGYYNQKAKKIKNFLQWFKTYDFNFQNFSKLKIEEMRRQLLEIKGIGPETADSILLYGLKKKIFVVDAYTKRIFSRLGFFPESYSYEQMQEFFHNILKEMFLLILIFML